jgi:hypothetical protein
MPSRLGRYAVRRRIGSGGFATVWLAYDEQLDSPVAVKVLADNWTEDNHVHTRFIEEGRFLRRVESPHVVSVYDAGELDDGRPYLVMSYADQGTLADRLEVEGLTVGQAIEVVRQVGMGLQALHDHGVLHRDVKPANVLFRTPDPASGSGGRGTVRAMLGDLGLGKAMDMSSRLTMIAGTPTFVAPEQAQGERLDPRADQYSLGALTFLLFTGRAPYAHASLAAAAAPGEAPPMSVPDREFPQAVEDVVRRALDPDREQRWPDVTAYIEALQEALGDATPAVMPEPWLPADPELTQPGARPSSGPPSGEPPEPAAPPHRRRHRVAVACAGLGALATGVAAGYGLHGTASEATVSDGTLSVTVPADWQRSVAREGWRPPNDRGRYAALSVGTAENWAAKDAGGEGVFLGILPGTELPTQVPQHPECRTAQSPVSDTGDLGEWVQVVYTRCPDGLTTVERVVQVATNRLLWVQVRSEDVATANSVLDSVSTSGI